MRYRQTVARPLKANVWQLDAFGFTRQDSPALMNDEQAKLKNGELKRDELLRSICKKKLVIVAGTGVSLYSIGYPEIVKNTPASWPGLLQNGLDFCKYHQLIEGDTLDVVELLLKKKDADSLIDAAQKIHSWIDRRGGNPRYHWLKESIGQLEIRKPELLNSLAKIDALIATLNYDDLIHKATGRQPIHWKQQIEIDSYLRDNSTNFILHLHGYWPHPDSIVLDRQSYEEILKCEQIQFLMRQFTRFNTILFVGCGETFSDPNFETLLKWSNEALKASTHQHYVLCREDDVANLMSRLKNYGILEPLVYGKSFNDLPQYLDRLATDSIKMNLSLSSAISSGQAPTTPNVQKPSDIWRKQWKR